MPSQPPKRLLLTSGYKARHNTYGIKAVNQTTYDFMKMAYYTLEGCADQIKACRASDISTDAGKNACKFATNVYRYFVELPYYADPSSDRDPYDVRQPFFDPFPPNHLVEYLNQAHVQQALGVNINYTTSVSIQVVNGFDSTGDYVSLEGSGLS